MVFVGGSCGTVVKHKIICPSCSKSYNVSQEKVLNSKGKMRCGDCRTRFYILLRANNDDRNEPTNVSFAAAEDQNFDIVVMPYRDVVEQALFDDKGANDLINEVDIVLDNAVSPILEHADAPLVLEDRNRLSEGLDLPSDGSDLDGFFTLDQRTVKKKWLRFWVTPFLFLAVVILLLLLAYQLWLRQSLAVFDNERFIAVVAPYATVVSNFTQEKFNVKFPVRQELTKLRLVSARLQQHPDRASTILLKLSISNESNIAQEFPWLELMLSDENGRLIARRTIEPKKYLYNNKVRTTLSANEIRPITIEFMQFPQKAQSYEIRIVSTPTDSE